MSIISGLLGEQPAERHALYGRVSTDEQAERRTIENQRHTLLTLAEAHGFPVAGVYMDDGVSGTVALGEREEGRRLLDDAKAGLFKVVYVFKLDRLGRNLKSLLEALEELDACGVTIKSASEPFDTGTPMGRFVFQLLGGLAELERATITERTGLGKARLRREGRYTGGPIPFGYAVDDKGYFVPSEEILEGTGLTEADWVRDLFERIAERRTTLCGESDRLKAAGIPHYYRYGGKNKGAQPKLGIWSQTRLGKIIHNPFYKGGTATRPTPALVDEVTWQRAADTLERNRQLSGKNRVIDYLLRGLVKCGQCGYGYAGGSSGSAYNAYRCNKAKGLVHGDRDCIGAMVRAARLEEAVWEHVKRFVDDPGEAIADAQAQLRARMAKTRDNEERRRQLSAELSSKETERQRVLGLYRRGRITDAECEEELAAIAAEVTSLRDLLTSLQVTAEMADAQEAYLSDVGAALATMRERVEAIDRTDDRAGKRKMIELLAPRIEVHTELAGPPTEPGPKGKVQRRRKRVAVHITLAFAPSSVVVPLTR